MESKKYICLGVSISGLIGVALLTFLPPVHVVFDWRAYSPYVVLSTASLIARGPRELNPLLIVTLVVVLGGTIAYLDSLRFNMVLSWSVFGLVESYVPIFQIIASAAVLCVIALRRFKNRRVLGDL